MLLCAVAIVFLYFHFAADDNGNSSRSSRLHDGVRVSGKQPHVKPGEINVDGNGAEVSLEAFFNIVIELFSLFMYTFFKTMSSSQYQN